MDGNVARGNLPIFLCIVAISLINQKIPFSRPSSRRSKVLSLSGTLREKFFAFEIGNRGFQSLFNLEPVLYIFVERGEINFSVGANIDGSQLFAEKGTTACSHSANYLFNYGGGVVILSRGERFPTRRRERGRLRFVTLDYLLIF